ncbi:MAG: hypothetical protein KFF73_00105 [Cyclobacteriaceae bacterium]|nr:hypothetical protein [Cyclobacteriaceae bacterium]
MKKVVLYSMAGLLAILGLLTLFLSTSIIFDLFGIRAKEGNYVFFVVLANFISSLIYLLAAYGFTKARKWVTHLLVISLILLLIAFSGLLLHISTGGIYETKTIYAMIFRIMVTGIFAAVAFVTVTKKDIKWKGSS